MRHLIMATAGIAAAVWAGQASAHAFLKASEPDVGSTVQQAPTQVQITFTQGVEPSFSTLQVKDASGARVDTGTPHLDGDNRHLAVALKPLAAGSYLVVWHAVSVDTHKTQGTFSFTVKP
jgi:methionine-rich copper-binding protein CopC